METLDSQSRLGTELEARLDAEPARAVLEYLLDRLGCGEGSWRVDVETRDGRFRRGSIRRGPFGADELERLGARDAPRLS